MTGDMAGAGARPNQTHTELPADHYPGHTQACTHLLIRKHMHAGKHTRKHTHTDSHARTHTGGLIINVSMFPEFLYSYSSHEEACLQ